MNFFVIESDWEEVSEEEYNSSRKKSILPLLECIKGINSEFSYIYKTANTEEELIYCLKNFLRLKEDEKEYVLVFCGHGKLGKIRLGAGDEHNEFSLEELSKICVSIDKNIFDNTLVHFDSCYIFRASTKRLNDFISKTSAITVTGFSESVSFIESYALELMLFVSLLEEEEGILKIIKNFYKTNKSFCNRIGFNWIKV